jgi:hypothetical protein
MTNHTANLTAETTNKILTAASTCALVLAIAGPSYTAQLPPPLSGKASDALVTLATTGNPDPLHAELGGTVISSEELQKKANALMKLQKSEHLAPKALVAPNGDVYAMVAPTVTKDNFILADGQGNVLRVDVGDSEGHRMPFVVETVVADGGTPWYVEFWRWITFQ